jgi:hypothetical protein
MNRNPATAPREGDTWVSGSGALTFYAHVDLVTDDEVCWRIVDRLDALAGAKRCKRAEWAEAVRILPRGRFIGNATEMEK